MTGKGGRNAAINAVGVTGLPCSGKSRAAERLAGLAGGEVIQADALGHAVLERPEARELLRLRLGAGILAADPAETRRRIADRVFSDPAALAWLESLVHPLVAAETAIRAARLAGKRLAVIEAALLPVADMEHQCDRVILIEAEFPIRLDRAARRGWNRDELERRDARLAPLFDPGRLAEIGGKLVCIRNDKDDGRLGDEVAAVWEKWRQSHWPPERRLD
ncbi:MAG: dephospho-CoA kinase [Planctomycetota bacterium]|jgi:dephospho-CoA kinase|nr:dephospho-CoA kinase [Planctomycetota bacterium]